MLHLGRGRGRLSLRNTSADESDYKDENKTFCFHNGERKQPAGLQSMHFRE